jgi:phage terminase large subunit-like protein
VDWITPFGEVDAAVREAFARWRVLRLYVDPQYAESLMDSWSVTFGGRVHPWPTNRARAMGAALQRFWIAAKTGEGLSHDGDTLLAQHVGNARVVRSQGHNLVGKDRPHSPRKIDLLVAAVLAFEAAADARVAGEDRRAERKVYRAAGF